MIPIKRGKAIWKYFSIIRKNNDDIYSVCNKCKVEIKNKNITVLKKHMAKCKPNKVANGNEESEQTNNADKDTYESEQDEENEMESNKHPGHDKQSNCSMVEHENKDPDDGNTSDKQLYWESDDGNCKTRRGSRKSGVTFKVDGKMSPRRSIDETNDDVDNMQNDEMIPADGDRDTDTDDEMFTHQRGLRRGNVRVSRSTRRGSSNTSKVSPKHEFEMNGDEDSRDNDEDNCNSGLRRSSRRRKFTYDQSWLVGDKRLRGYPNMMASSENEDIQHRRRYVDSDGEHDDDMIGQRRSLRSTESRQNVRLRRPSRYRGNDSDTSPRRGRRYKEDIEDEDTRPKTRHRFVQNETFEEDQDTHRLGRQRRIRRVPLRFLDDESEHSGDDTFTSRMRTRRHIPKEEIESKDTSSKPKFRRVGRKPKVKEVDEQEDDNEGGEEGGGDDVVDEEKENDHEGDDEDEGDETKELKEEKNSDESEKDEENEDIDVRKTSHRTRPVQLRRRKRNREEENYEARIPSKRVRRPVTRFSYEPKSSVSTKMSSSSSGEDDDDDDEDEDDDEEDEEESAKEGTLSSKGRTRYALRRNRREQRPFQLTPEKRGSGERRFRDEGNGRHRSINEPKDDYPNSPARKIVFNRSRKVPNISSSSSDEGQFEQRKAKSMAKSRNRCLPMNIQPEDLAHQVIRDRAKVGTSLADIDPMSIDRSITWEKVGGLSKHIQALKEMVIFPLMYSEVFEKFNIAPPRGVIFYGPPGTGKTLMARALSNECSVGDRKVAFFMRKGADCLSKWVGESERQLRLLFDQAYQMRPSIIFFDEIDGLAPVRSSRQDQIHSSIVSTLLALMDGLDSRGEVVVIGATNRLDAIDPALRRPGRFDREFHFPLPSAMARRQILRIHTKSWNPLPSKRLVHHLGEQTVGYCGADLKSLCAESALISLRSRYPQIYSSKKKLVLDISQIKIRLCHFRLAMAKIVPAGQRTISSVGRRLNTVIKPLLQPTLTRALRLLSTIFPHGFASSNSKNLAVHRPRLLLSGSSTQGQSTHLGPAIVHALEKLPTHKLDLATLYSVATRAPEEACAQVFQEARRNLPSIIYIPHIDQWWGSSTESLKATFGTMLRDVDPATPLFLLATSDISYNDLDEEIKHLFNVYKEEVFTMINPEAELRRQFFHPLFYVQMTKKPNAQKKKIVKGEVLPEAPPEPPRKLSPEELQRLEETEEATLRELRIFLRQICAKLARNRMFYTFTKPVDMEEVPDYLEIITNPMDLETMMTKIDQYQYQCAEDFLKDIDQICSNALEYNPDRNPEDKLIRHRACTLRDTAYAYIKAEMDTDFEYKCREIRDNRANRARSPTNSAPAFVHVGPPTPAKNSTDKKKRLTPLAQYAIMNSRENTGDDESSEKEIPTKKSKSLGDFFQRKRRRKSAWSRGLLVNKKRKSIPKEDEEGNKKEEEEEDDEDEDDEEEEEDEEDAGEIKVEEEEELEVKDEANVDSTNKEGESELGVASSDKELKESELAIFNGHVGTEDSHDSMKVTSAGDVIVTPQASSSTSRRSSQRSTLQESVLEIPTVEDVDNEDSVVSSSEQGCTEVPEVTIDWSYLETIYELCITKTEGITVEEMQQLHTVLTSLCYKHAKFLDRTPLVRETEAEIIRFAQFCEKS